jgi:PAS domain S-box-containing protein
MHGRPHEEQTAAAPGELADELYEDAPCGYISAAPGGELLQVNRTLLHWTGYTREELIGRRFQDLLTAGGRIYHETHYAPLLRMQGAVREIALEFVCADGRCLPVLVNSVLRTDDDGRPRLVRTTVFDATHRRRYERELLLARERAARRRMERLQRLSAVLAAAVDTREMATAAVDELAEDPRAIAVTLALADPLTGQLQVAARRAVAAAGAPATGDLTAAARASLDEIMRAGRMLLWSASTSEESAPPLAALVAEAVQAIVVLPLAPRGEPIGVTLICFGEPREFDEEAIAFMDACARQCSQALERARLYDNQKTIAHVLQQSLLAAEPPQDERFAVAARYMPAVASLDVGGDWHDTFCIGDGAIGFVVGDVVGRGIEAATAMGQLRSAVRALAGANFGPAEMLAHLDGFVAQLPRARMATLAYAELDLRTGRLRYASAGHPPMLLMQPGEPALLHWDGRSMPLGAGLGPRSGSVGELDMRPRARLLLYTDGLIERRAESIDDGLDTLVAAVQARRGIAIGALLDELVQDGPDGDDVCLLCLEYTPMS